MAYSTVETKIQNPGEIISLVLGNPSRPTKKRKAKSMAKPKRKGKMPAGLRKYWAKKRAAKRNRSAAAKKRHAKRTNPARAKKRTPKRKIHRARTAPAVRDVNFVLGNPARKKGQRTMARTKKRRRNTAGSHKHRRSAKRTTRRVARRRNPGSIGRPMDWVKGGAAVLGGVVVARALPQAVAAQYNTGITGYALNAAAAVAAAWATHAVTKDQVLTAGVAAGGFAAMIARIISDKTPYGDFLAAQGFGDYQFSNFVNPQRIVAWQNAQMQVPQGWNGSPLPALSTAMYGSAGDMGRRGGAC